MTYCVDAPLGQNRQILPGFFVSSATILTQFRVTKFIMQCVDAAIRHAGTREPWKLIRLGYEHDEHYLAKVMAAVLVLKDRAGYR